MPSFLISAGASITAEFLFEYKGQVYQEDGHYRFPLDGVFMYGTKDIYREWFLAHELYSREVIIVWYDQGHTFPRALGHEEFEKVAAFIMDKHQKRFSSKTASSSSP
jgi:hypothetical protein